MRPHCLRSVPLSQTAAGWATSITAMRVVQLAATACALSVCLACGSVTDTVAVGLAASSGGTASGGGGGSAAIQCGDSYPQLVWPGDTGGLVCTPELAPTRMSRALCSCGDVGTFGGLRTDAFDSAAQALAPGAAAVGINGEYRSPSPMTIGGSLTVASPAVLALSLLDVHGDLRLAGELQVAGPLSVARDAWFAEAATALTLVNIGRDVHQVPGKTLDASIPRGIRGQLVSEDFSVAPPCPCDDAEVGDWASIIGSASTQNDNASIGLSAAALVQPTEALDLTLRCGRFYVSGIGSSLDIELRVMGRVALFVAGDVLGSGRLRVDLAAGAELDWFIAGRLDLANAVQVGDAARPAALRVYVAGDGQLSVPQEAVFANLYAPRADVVLLGKADLYGSVFGHTVSSVKDITVHYDAAVQRAADGCADAQPSSCSGCGQCGPGRACVAGNCGACGGDADCCWPLLCDGGRCVAFKE